MVFNIRVKKKGRCLNEKNNINLLFSDGWSVD